MENLIFREKIPLVCGVVSQRIRYGFTICVNHRDSTESEEKHSEMEETDLNGHSWVIL